MIILMLLKLRLILGKNGNKVEEKRKDLKNSKQKVLITEIVGILSKAHPSFYYLSTVEIATEVKNYIQDSGKLSQSDYELVKSLGRRDIQILLSLH